MPKAPGGVLPRRTADPQECRDIALADGAVVLTQLPEPVAATAGGCAELPVHVWGEQLRGYARPCEISISLLPESAGAAAGRQITFESFQGKAGVDLAEIVRAVNAGELQVSDADQMGTTDYAHTDGWAGEVQQPGVDLRPDFFFLVCASRLSSTARQSWTRSHPPPERHCSPFRSREGHGHRDLS